MRIWIGPERGEISDVDKFEVVGIMLVPEQRGKLAHADEPSPAIAGVAPARAKTASRAIKAIDLRISVLSRVSLATSVRYYDDTMG